MNTEGKLKILVVDDEPDALELYKDLFTKKGYEVVCASGGMEALDLIEEPDIDVVLLDIRMPGMDGQEALLLLKQKKPDLPVVMITAYGYDKDRVNTTLEQGAAGYISKSLPLAQIVHTFQTLLSAIKRKKDSPSSQD